MDLFAWVRLSPHCTDLEYITVPRSFSSTIFALKNHLIVVLNIQRCIYSDITLLFHELFVHYIFFNGLLLSSSLSEPLQTAFPPTPRNTSIIVTSLSPCFCKIENKCEDYFTSYWIYFTFYQSLICQTLRRLGSQLLVPHCVIHSLLSNSEAVLGCVPFTELYSDDQSSFPCNVCIKRVLYY